MKKRILGVLITLVMLIGLVTVMSISASADTVTYGLWVGGEQFTSEKLTVTGGGGTATYDPDTNTLTLDNYSYTGAGYVHQNSAMIFSELSDTLNIVLKGINTLTGQNNSNGIHIYSNYGSLHISDFAGDNSTGVLNIESNVGIIMSLGSRLTLDDVTLNIKSAYVGLNCPGATLYPTNSTVTITSTNSNAVGELRGINFTDGAANYNVYNSMYSSFSIPDEAKVNISTYQNNKYIKIAPLPPAPQAITAGTATNGTFTVSERSASKGTEITVTATPDTGYTVGAVKVYKTGDESTTVTVTDGKFIMPNYPVTVSVTFAKAYDLWVGGVQVTDANKDNIVVPGATGTAKYDPDSKTLTLNNFSYEGDGYMYGNSYGYDNYAAVYSGTDLTVKLVGTNNVTSSVTGYKTGVAFCVQGALTITDDTADETDSVLNLTGCSGEGLLSEGVLTIKNVTVKSTGVGDSGICCKNAVNINNAIVNIESDNGQALYSYDAITVNDSNVTVSSDKHLGVLLLNSNVMNISNSTVEITAGSEKNAIFVVGSEDDELGKEFVPVFDSAVIVKAGDDAASATEADAKASETYKNRYIKIIPACTVAANYGVDGVDNKEITVTMGDTISLENPVVDGYIFMGWYADADFTTAFDFTNPITEDVTVYAKFADYEGDKEALQDAIDDLETAVNNVETALNNKVSTEKLTEEIGKLNQAIADAKAYADTQDAALKTTLEAADATMNAAITALQNRVTALEAGLTTANGNINTNTGDITALKTDVSILKAWQTEAQSAIEALQTLTGTQGANISALQTAVADLENALTKANDKITAAEVRIAALEGRVTDLEAARAALESAVADLENAVATKADTTTLNEKVDALNTAITNAEKAAKDYADAQDVALKSALETAIEAAKDEAISAAETLVNNAKAELQSKINTKADAATTAEAIQNLQAAVAALQAVKDNYATADATLKADLESKIATAKSDAITAANTALTTAKNELSQAIALKADTATLNAKVDALNIAIANAESVAKAYADTQDDALKAELQTAIANAKSEAIGAAQVLVDNAKAALQTAIDTKADTATVNAAIANLQNAITALEAVKDNYISADAALKLELEAAIERAKQEAIEAAKGYIPYIGTNGNWWIGESDTGIKVEADNGLAILAIVIGSLALVSNIALAAWLFIKKKNS